VKKERNLWMKDTGGEIMIESVLVYIPTLFVIVFLVALGLIYYQQWNVQFVADAVAENVAMSYGYDSLDGTSMVLEEADITGRRTYRYSLGKNKTVKLAKQLGENYGSRLFRLTNLAKAKENSEIVTVDIVPDSLGRRHVEVSVEGTYQMLFSEGLRVFGFGEQYHYEAVSVADCIDPSALGSTILFTKRGVNIIANDSKILKSINKWMKTIKDFIAAWGA
jgi:hypothetical protein